MKLVMVVKSRVIQCQLLLFLYYGYIAEI